MIKTLNNSQCFVPQHVAGLRTAHRARGDAPVLSGGRILPLRAAGPPGEWGCGGNDGGARGAGDDHRWPSH